MRGRSAKRPSESGSGEPQPVAPGRRRGPLTPTAWLTAEKLAQQGLWLLLFAILAPLLGPRPYGLFSLTMVLVGFCEIVLAEAAAEALLSLETMDASHIGAANLCNLCVGMAAGALTVALAGPLALAFRAPELRPMFFALSPLPVLSSMVSAPTAVLKREMRFQPFAVRSILGLGLGGLVGVVAAVLGFGVWALVMQVLVQRLAEVSILLASTPQALRFGWRRDAFDELRDCAVDVLGARGLTWASGQLPRLVVGAMLGPTLLGMFTLATRIADMLVQVVLAPATLVARVELRRFADAPAQLESAVHTLVRRLSVYVFPVCAGAAAITPVLFDGWLGRRWHGAQGATQLIVLTLAPSIFFYCTTAILMGLRLSRAEVGIQLAVSVSAVLVTWAAAPFGLDAVAAALLGRLVLLLLLPLAILRRRTGLRPLGVLNASAGAAVAATLMGLSVTLASPWLEGRLGPLRALLVMVAMGAVEYGAFALVLVPSEAQAILARLRSSAGALALRVRTSVQRA